MYAFNHFHLSERSGYTRGKKLCLALFSFLLFPFCPLAKPVETCVVRSVPLIPGNIFVIGRVYGATPSYSYGNQN